MTSNQRIRDAPVILAKAPKKLRSLEERHYHRSSFLTIWIIKMILFMIKRSEVQNSAKVKLLRNSKIPGSRMKLSNYSRVTYPLLQSMQIANCVIMSVISTCVQ